MLLNIFLFITSLLSTGSIGYDLEISMPEVISVEDTVAIDVKFHNNSNQKVLIGYSDRDFFKAVRMHTLNILNLIVFNDDIYFLSYSNQINYPYSVKPIKVKKNSTHLFQIKVKFDQMTKAGEHNGLDWSQKIIRPLANGEYFIQMDMLLSNTRIRSNILKVIITD